MKVSKETAGTREVKLTIEPDPETIDKALRKAAREISRVRPLRGYRPGKAPYALVERLYGREMILSEALQDLGPELYRQALQEAEVEPFAQGSLDVASNDPLVLTAEVPLLPVVNLGDLKALHIEPEPPVTLTEVQIDEQVENLRRVHAEHETVERPSQMGDQVVADIHGVADGEPVVDRHDSTFTLSDEVQPAGFAEALLGMQAEEERTFTLTYPEDFEDSNLAGKNVEFTAKLTTVRETRLPAVDDELAKMAGDYETLTDLRDALAQGLRQRLEAQAATREGEAAINALVEQTEFEYPAAALEDELERLLNDRKSRIQSMGIDWETYLRLTGTSEDSIRQELSEPAERSLRQRLALYELAKTEGLELSNDEITNELRQFSAEMSATYGERADQMIRRLDTNRVFQSLYSDGVLRKAMRHLRALLTGRESELEYSKPENSAETTEPAAQSETEES